MKLRAPLLLLLGLLACLAQLGLTCNPVLPLILAPGPLVSSFQFTVEVEIPDELAFDPATGVTINGEGVPLAGGPGVFSAELGPGGGLRDANVLLLHATRKSDGTPVTVGRPFEYLPPGKARAFRVTDAADCVTGPQAHCREGDWMLSNDAARFVVQDAPQRDMWSVGQYGGNLIDAELVEAGVPQGNDNFLEIQPGLNVESVVDAQTVEIVNDGQNGLAARVRTCGPDDLLDFANPSTSIREQGIALPAALEQEDDKDHQVEACTEYALEPGQAYVRMDTEVFNQEAADLGLFVGDWINGAGSVDSWSVTAPSSFVSGGGIGEPLTGSLQGFEYIGFGPAEGVNYSLVQVPFEGATAESDFLTAAGVSVLLQNASLVQTLLTGAPAQFVVPAAGSKTYTRFFGVNDGSGRGAVDLDVEVRGRAAGTLQGCVTIGGEPAAGARVAAVTKDGAKIQDLVAHFVTRDDGCYAGRVPVGSYLVIGGREGAPFEGGGPAPLEHPVVIAEGAVVVQDIALPATGRLQVNVLDADLQPLPARVTVVGFDPSPNPTITSSGLQATLLGADTTGVLRSHGKDDLRFGIAAIAYAGADGSVELDVEPGSYQVYVSRGYEYSLYDEPVTIVAGALTQVDARIARVLDTPGFVTSDFHVHGLKSADSNVSRERRAIQFAGEGVDNIVMTEHNAREALNTPIAELELVPFVHATVGEEITTWDYGHFNGYPYTVDPGRPSGGSLDWGIQAPAGEAFPAFGNYILTPAELDAKGTTGPGTTAESVVQINHISSTFGPLRIDTAVVPPQSNLTPDDLLDMRIDPTAGNIFHHFRAMELVNGDSQGAFDGFVSSHMGIWFNHLNQGLHVTGTGVTDTHNFFKLGASGARTWTASPVDDPAAIDSLDVGASVKAGRAVIGMGAFVTARLVADDGSGNAADLGWGGSTQVTTTNGAVRLEISVQAPVWAPYDRIEIYANAATQVTGTVDGIPVFYTALPTAILEAGSDFPVDVVTVDRDVPGAQRLETVAHSVPFVGLTEDTWFVVVVRGTGGVSQPMFPVVPASLSAGSNPTLADLVDGNLGEGGTRANAITNPLYADVDGVPGFQAPLGGG